MELLSEVWWVILIDFFLWVKIRLSNELRKNENLKWDFKNEKSSKN